MAEAKTRGQNCRAHCGEIGQKLGKANCFDSVIGSDHVHARLFRGQGLLRAAICAEQLSHMNCSELFLVVTPESQIPFIWCSNIFHF